MKNDNAFLGDLDSFIRRENFWRLTMSIPYTTSAALAILCSGAATVVYGLGYGQYGSALAAMATVILGVEKALLLREKWAHHLTTSGELRAVQTRYKYGGLRLRDAASLVAQIDVNYAEGLPIAGRDQTDTTDTNPPPEHGAPANDN